MKKYSPDDILKPTIIEIEQKFIEQNNKTRNLQESLWDMTYQGKIKIKVDYKNKVNVIYQNSFGFYKIENNTVNIDTDAFKFVGLMHEKISRNNFPIVIIEDFNAGGLIGYVFFLLNAINPELSLNSLNIAMKVLDKNNTEYEIDNYGNGIKHKRSKINKTTFNAIWNVFSKSKYNMRKPNQIIVFTDGFSYSATSLFIKNLQESGNAIIVGYNGNPSVIKKHDKFDSSQAPSAVNVLFKNDTNVINLSKYGIIVNGITFGETFNDSYINKEKTPIPREYIINPIDERSNIYGKYNDNRYKCIDGRWRNTCQISNCKKPYIFDTYVKRCFLPKGNRTVSDK